MLLPLCAATLWLLLLPLFLTHHILTLFSLPLHPSSPPPLSLPVYRPWQLLSDGYSFDLQQRPPTAALDLLSSYLEIRYADVLLQRDAVQTTNRQLALQSLLSGNTSSSSSSGWGSGGFITSFSEVVESPPTALTAAKTLSPQEREAVGKTLDDMLSSRQYSGYREAVLQLYCDGLVGWGELQECWAAAQAGEEAAAATEGPVSISGESEAKSEREGKGRGRKRVREVFALRRVCVKRRVHVWV